MNAPSLITPRARVAVFAHDLSGTGVARNARALAAALAAEYEVELIACRGGAMAQGVGHFTLTTLGAPERMGPADVAQAVLRLRARLVEARPAVAISAGNRGHAMLVAATAGLTAPRRIYRMSNDLAHGRKGAARSGLAKFANDLQTAAVVGDVTRLVLVSEHLLEDSRLARVAALGKAVVIENGVDVDGIRARALEQCDHPFTAPGAPPFVVAVGRMVAQKNFGLLVEAVALANRTTPLNLLILGGGGPGAMAALQARAALLGIGDRLALPGYVANPFAYIARARVFALPSWWEGASNVLLEALAVGTPVVGSTSAGNAAAVLDGGTYGVLADPDDPAAWATALLSQAGPDAVTPGDRVDDYRLSDTLAAWTALVGAELVAGAPISRSR
ncbi:glycosyltransferase [Sphingosinicellaceae bacterium]|nr:glycosyltransferase [Sphingosinicellaceae bacterium]